MLAFVRLAKGCHLGEMTEVSIPVRFLFVLLGPSKDGESYHQIGRSIATLMSDQASKLLIMIYWISSVSYITLLELSDKSTMFSQFNAPGIYLTWWTRRLFDSYSLFESNVFIKQGFLFIIFDKHLFD